MTSAKSRTAQPTAASSGTPAPPPTPAGGAPRPATAGDAAAAQGGAEERPLAVEREEFDHLNGLVGDLSNRLKETADTTKASIDEMKALLQGFMAHPPAQSSGAAPEAAPRQPQAPAPKDTSLHANGSKTVEFPPPVQATSEDAGSDNGSASNSGPNGDSDDDEVQIVNPPPRQDVPAPAPAGAASYAAISREYLVRFATISGSFHFPRNAHEQAFLDMLIAATEDNDTALVSDLLRWRSDIVKIADEDDDGWTTVQAMLGFHAQGLSEEGQRMFASFTQFRAVAKASSKPRKPHNGGNGKGTAGRGKAPGPGRKGNGNGNGNGNSKRKTGPSSAGDAEDAE
jgi:hypothetical protein